MPYTGILQSHFWQIAHISRRCYLVMRFGWGGVRPPVRKVTLYSYRVRMRSAGEVYDMKEVECGLKRKQFHGFKIKIVFTDFERCTYAA